MRSRRIFTSLNSSKHVPIAKTCSHRFWSEYNLSKHVPVAKYWFVLFWIPWRISEIVWFYMLVFIRGSKVSKKELNLTEKLLFVWWSKIHCWNHVPIAFGMITICQNTFPSLLPLFGNGNVFWQIENAGNNGKLYLKTRSHRKKNAQKCP